MTSEIQPAGNCETLPPTIAKPIHKAMPLRSNPTRWANTGPMVPTIAQVVPASAVESAPKGERRSNLKTLNGTGGAAAGALRRPTMIGTAASANKTAEKMNGPTVLGLPKLNRVLGQRHRCHLRNDVGAEDPPA